MLEKRGIAAAPIITDTFIPSAQMTAKTFGIPDYPFAVVQQPIGSVNHAELDKRAEAVILRVIALLKPQGA